MTNFIGVVHKEKRSAYGVSFPDLPGCITTGKTIDEAKDRACEALSFHIEGMLEDGDEIPSPSSLENIMNDPEYSDGIAYLVISVRDPHTKRVRVNITIPEETLHRIDENAKKKGMSRSAFIVRAANNEMKGVHAP